MFPPGEKKEKKIQHLQVPSNPALVYGEVKGCEKTNLRETECVCLGVGGYEGHLILRNAI